MTNDLNEIEKSFILVLSLQEQLYLTSAQRQFKGGRGRIETNKGLTSPSHFVYPTILPPRLLCPTNL